MLQVLSHCAQLGPVLKARRQSLGMTQGSVAAKLAISQNRLSQIETDPHTLTAARLLDLCNVLGLDVIVQDRPPISPEQW